MNEQTQERPVTVGYLKQLFERLSLPDDSVLYYNGPEYGWDRVGPEGQEILFITPIQHQEIVRRIDKLRTDFPVMYRRRYDAHNEVILQIKKESGQ